MMSCASLPEGRGRRVLVTRPEPAATTTSARLRRAGFVPVTLPLTRTVSLEFAFEQAGFDVVTVTSANAFRHIDEKRLALLRHYPLYAVGDGTARAAKQAGFASVIDGGGDAERLAVTLKQHVSQTSRILYLAGKVRQPVFENRIAEFGLLMTVHDVYDIAEIAYLPAEIDNELQGRPLNIVMLYSGVTARNLLRHASSFANSITMSTRFLCIAPRIAELLPQHWKDQSETATHPDENGMFELLGSF